MRRHNDVSAFLTTEVFALDVDLLRKFLIFIVHLNNIIEFD